MISSTVARKVCTSRAAPVTFDGLSPPAGGYRSATGRWPPTTGPEVGGVGLEEEAVGDERAGLARLIEGRSARRGRGRCRGRARPGRRARRLAPDLHALQAEPAQHGRARGRRDRERAAGDASTDASAIAARRCRAPRRRHAAHAAPARFARGGSASRRVLTAAARSGVAGHSTSSSSSARSRSVTPPSRSSVPRERAARRASAEACERAARVMPPPPRAGGRARARCATSRCPPARRGRPRSRPR